jgi:hypothetical protein
MMERDAWAELWRSVRPDPHPDPGALGEYGLMLCWYGAASAREAFVEVAAHLDTGCARCAEDLQEIVTFAEQRRGPSAGSG